MRVCFCSTWPIPVLQVNISYLRTTRSAIQVLVHLSHSSALLNFVPSKEATSTVALDSHTSILSHEMKCRTKHSSDALGIHIYHCDFSCAYCEPEASRIFSFFWRQLNILEHQWEACPIYIAGPTQAMDSLPVSRLETCVIPRKKRRPNAQFNSCPQDVCVRLDTDPQLLRVEEAFAAVNVFKLIVLYLG